MAAVQMLMLAGLVQEAEAHAEVAHWMLDDTKQWINDCLNRDGVA